MGTIAFEFPFYIWRCPDHKDANTSVLTITLNSTGGKALPISKLLQIAMVI